MKATYFGGKTSGYTADDKQAGFETKTPWSVALSGEFLAANTNWRFFNSFIKPYASIGVGVMNAETAGITGGNRGEYGDSYSKIYVPADFGFKFAVAKGINFELGYQLNWVNQRFDNMANPAAGPKIDKNDLFTYAHAGLEFALGVEASPH